MASEIVERETTTNVLHSPFCVTFRESYKIEESKSTFDTYLFISNFTIHKVLQTPKFTFRFLNSNEWATHYLQMHMLSQIFETVRTSILCWCFLFRWTNKTGSKWFKILRNWEFLQQCVEYFLLIFSFCDRILLYLKFGCFSFTTHSLYSLDKRGGVELGLSFPLQWHYSYRQLVKKFLANTNKLSIRKAQAGILQRVPHSAS